MHSGDVLEPSKVGEWESTMREPTNEDRAGWANTAVTAFAEAVRETDMLDEEKGLVISDLLCDMMHLCDMEEIDWDRCVVRARGHYLEER